MLNTLNQKLENHIIKYYIADEMVKNREHKYKVYSKNTVTGKCTIEYVPPIKIITNKNIHRFDNHVMSKLKLKLHLAKIHSAIKNNFSVDSNCKVERMVYSSYLADVENHIKTYGYFRCCLEAMTNNIRKMLTKNGYKVRQSIKHFLVTSDSITWDQLITKNII